eukprot:jgi/Astpho2/4421/Aster-x1241
MAVMLGLAGTDQEAWNAEGGGIFTFSFDWRLGWISFWTQLSLSVVSAIILSFAVSATMQGNAPGNVSIYFTLFGVITSFLSTFFAWGYVKVARRVFAGEAVTKENVASSLLRNSRVNLWGMGATLLGLQSMTGVLVAKILTTSSTNPYSAAGSGAARAGPAALDLFTVQASANTLLAHFAGLVFTNWLLRLVNEDAAPAKMSNPGKGSSGNTVFPKPA